MNTFTKLLLLVPLIPAVTLLQADERPSGFYVGGLVSADALGSVDITRRTAGADGAKTEQRFDTGGGAGLSFGYLIPRFRFEIETGIKRQIADEYIWKDAKLVRTSKDEDETERIYGMANVYYDHPFGERWEWYVGAGCGVIKVDGEAVHDGQRFSYDTSKVGWQVLTGIAYRVTERLTLHGGVRFATLGSSTVRTDTKLRFETASSLELGVRFRL